MWFETISEWKELFKRDTPEARILGDPKHLEASDRLFHGIPVTQVIVKSEQAAELVDRAPGTYVTILTGALDQCCTVDTISSCIAEHLRQFLIPFFGGTLLICGVGNQEQESDSLGPEAVRRLPLTALEALQIKPAFARMSAVCPGVTWQTNLDTATMVAGIAASVGASCVLLVDSLVCSSFDRLCRNIQLSNTGLSGYGASRRLDSGTIKAPVLSIGVPTAIPANAISREYVWNTPLTVSNISGVIKTAAYVIATAILQASCPELDAQEAGRLVGYKLIW